MEKKMTSGEIAKKAGISQKTIRLYDEKGLLKPSDYSEGNYRLYDKEALLVLEKIMALKQIGFSLEEIRDNLIAGREMDITCSLRQQLKLMEAKKQEMEKSIACIKGVLSRSDEPDWDSVTEIIRMMQTDQKADERHFDALKHMTETLDWYVRIYRTLPIKAGDKVLDLGCGFAKLWRNNWTQILEKVQITGVDLHGSWADDFDNYIKEHKSELAQEVEISLLWGDVEEEATWQQLEQEAPYSLIIAHYLEFFIQDWERLTQRVANSLVQGGLFSCNGPEVSAEHRFWMDILREAGLDCSFITNQMAEHQKQCQEFTTKLQEVFGRVEAVELPNAMGYEHADELLDRLYEHYPENQKYLKEHEKQIRNCLEQHLVEEGIIVLPLVSTFYHCYK